MATDPSPMQQIFSESNLVLAIFGAMGGLVRSAALRTTWLEGLRVTFIGSLFAFGVGTLAPYLLRPWIGELPPGASQALGFLTACAFLIGLLGVTLIERLVAGKPLQDRQGGNGY